MRSSIIFGLGLALVSLLVSCSPPRRDYPSQKIAQVRDFDELMWVLATVADPRFERATSLLNQAPDSAAVAEFLDMGRRVAAAGRRLPEFSQGPGFDSFAVQLVARAVEVERQAATAPGPGLPDLVLRVKDSCRDCHRAYR